MKVQKAIRWLFLTLILALKKSTAASSNASRSALTTALVVRKFNHVILPVNRITQCVSRLIGFTIKRDTHQQIDRASQVNVNERDWLQVMKS